MRGRAGPLRLRHKVGDSIARHALWQSGDRVAVAVSGGRDSIALLDLLCETAAWHGGRLSLVTVNHGTRPDAADDADFVESVAEERGLTCHRVDVALGPDASEAACRTARMAAFEALDVERIALGHHQQDQAETHWMRVLQGSGRRGMGAMGWRRGRLVRPLLDVTPAELQAWVDARGLAFRQDPTNRSPRFLRNRIRHELMPVLEDLRPGATAAAAAAAAWLREEDAWLAEQVPPEVTVRWVAEAPIALVGRWLHRQGLACTPEQAAHIRRWAKGGADAPFVWGPNRLETLDDGTVVSR